MKITEIDYTAGNKPLIVNDHDIITNSYHVGYIDNREVKRYDHESQYLLFFSTDETIDAYILIVGNDIRGMQNILGTSGLITALIAFAVKEYGSLHFVTSEPFSPDGFKWLKGFIENKGRAMKVTDQNGNFPDITNLEKEWKTAMTSSGHGPTSITISEGFHRQFTDPNHLQPRTYYINHLGTL